jgi:hypothetical protein
MEGSIDKKTTAKNGQDHSAVTQSDDVPQYSEYERWVRRYVPIWAVMAWAGYIIKSCYPSDGDVDV